MRCHLLNRSWGLLYFCELRANSNGCSNTGPFYVRRREILDFWRHRLYSSSGFTGIDYKKPHHQYWCWIYVPCKLISDRLEMIVVIAKIITTTVKLFEQITRS